MTAVVHVNSSGSPGRQGRCRRLVSGSVLTLYLQRKTGKSFPELASVPGLRAAGAHKVMAARRGDSPPIAMADGGRHAWM